MSFLTEFGLLVSIHLFGSGSSGLVFMASDHTANATITYRHDINSELSIIRVSPDSGEVPQFEAGQYAEIALVETVVVCTVSESVSKRKLERRAFSICSSPQKKAYLEFYISLIPSGLLTPKLWQMNINDRLWLGPKIKGKFTLSAVSPEASDNDFIFIATGTGLAPYMAMIRQHQDDNFSKKPWRRCIVIHGVRYEKDLGYREELETLVKSTDSILYLPIVSRERENSGWKGLHGRVQKVFEQNHLESIIGTPLLPKDTQVFLCGNPEMIDSMQELLIQKGFSPHSKKHPGNIHFERYW